MQYCSRSLADPQAELMLYLQTIQNESIDPKRIENIIYTLIKFGETLQGRHTYVKTSCSEDKKFCKSDSLEARKSNNICFTEPVHEQSSNRFLHPLADS